MTEITVYSAPLSWQATPGLTYEEWETILKQLLKARDRLQFVIGDCLNAGDELFGEDAAQALSPEDEDYGKLRNWQWVARRVSIATRVAQLKWSYHRLVAKFGEEIQAALLAEAVEYRLSYAAFRDHIQEFERGLPDHEPATIVRSPEPMGSLVGEREDLNEVQSALEKINRRRWHNATGAVLPVVMRQDEDEDLAIYTRVLRDVERWTIADHCLQAEQQARHMQSLYKWSPAKYDTEYKKRRGFLCAQYEIDQDTFDRYAEVARVFPQEQRRQTARVGYAHHEALIWRSREEQDYYLNRAAKEEWTVQRLKDELSGVRT